MGFAYTMLGDAAVGRSTTTLPNGRITVGVLFERGNDETGVVNLVAQGRNVGSMSIPDATRISTMRGVDVGRGRHAPITGLYKAPFEFTGIIHSVDLRVERADRPR